MSVEIPDQREPLTQDGFANPVWFEFLSELARQHNQALARISTLEQQVADLEARVTALETP